MRSWESVSVCRKLQSGYCSVVHSLRVYTWTLVHSLVRNVRKFADGTETVFEHLLPGPDGFRSLQGAAACKVAVILRIPDKMTQHD